METPAGPVLRFAVREDGSLEVLSPWFPFIKISEADTRFGQEMRIFLKGVDKGYAWHADELTFSCMNGGARYRLGPFEGGVAHGRLMESW